MDLSSSLPPAPPFESQTQGRPFERCQCKVCEFLIYSSLAFTMALAFGLQGGGYTPTELTTEAAVTLEPEGKGFRITRSALTLRAQVPNLDETTFAEMARDAEKNCPVSKVLNAAVTLDAKLI